MVASKIPTVRRQRLGTELRRLRERAGMSATAAAGLLGGNQAQISNIESGRHGVSADRVRTLACNYECTDEELISALVGMTGDRERHWWEEYRGVLPSAMQDLAELEHHATALRIAHSLHFPGLLQTAEHARTVFRQVVPTLPPHEVEHRVSHRIKRQTILYRDAAASLTVVLHEAALRMKFGGPEVTRDQLRHLAEASTLSHVTIQVIPFDAGGFPGSGQSAFYAAAPVPQLDTVQLDQSHGPVFLDAEAQLSKYRTLLDRLEAVALTPKKSRDFINDIAHQLGKA
ncbi:helix-turn-helix transcriptional regulator [Streptomyces sp. N2-109]|uniref:Helix-turn-helix transcriptional regulator n=1 Tax=Streptomyces gossypii TaxID=2883101 RepID=A0ABT2K1Q3_9ACTN|nr:helix-turn-helix transcriptional regulator [Streptomyces gossypii]MCT2594104.1 helix-turn-helix transcriptional regulator [Streptomyces gossypii]